MSVIGQVKLDTLYYDKDWKGVENKVFASYFRVLSSSEDSSYRKPLRDYYITGELQSESGYITIDKYDDSNSVFDGEWISYYKSGQIEEKGTRIRGKQEGEYVRYNEDGLILLHAYFKDDQLDGIYTEFSEDGNLSMQIEYKEGKPLYDYCVLSNQEGFCSKVRLSDNQPIYESPAKEEKRVEYVKGESWAYYNKNGILVGVTNNEVRDYGKYFQIEVIIDNQSMYPIEFDPEQITASLIDKKGEQWDLRVFTAEEYMRKVRRNQNWSMIFKGLNEGMAVARAGYSSSTTNSSYSDHSSSYGDVSVYDREGSVYDIDYSDRTSSYGHSVSSTVTYDEAAAYQARVIASNRIAAYNESLLTERAAKDEEHLKKSTLYPGEAMSGYINVAYKRGLSMTVNIDIHGAVYVFSWDLSE